MRTLLALLCGLALVSAARGEKGQKHSATQAKTSHNTATHSQHASNNGGHPQNAATHNQAPASNTGHVQHVEAPQNVILPRANAARAPAGTHSAPIGQPGHPQPQGGLPQNAAASVQPAARPLTKEQQAEISAQDQGF